MRERVALAAISMGQFWGETTITGCEHISEKDAGGTLIVVPDAIQAYLGCMLGFLKILDGTLIPCHIGALQSAQNAACALLLMPAANQLLTVPIQALVMRYPKRDDETRASVLPFQKCSSGFLGPSTYIVEV